MDFPPAVGLLENRFREHQLHRSVISFRNVAHSGLTFVELQLYFESYAILLFWHVLGRL